MYTHSLSLFLSLAHTHTKTHIHTNFILHICANMSILAHTHPHTATSYYRCIHTHTKNTHDLKLHILMYIYT